MKRPVKRSLGILDGMLLVAGAAIAIALMRLYFVNNYTGFFGGLERTPDNFVYVRWIMGEAADFSCLWLTALTPVVFFIRLRRPRPAIRRLLLQPGATASFAVVVVVVFGAIMTAISVGMEGSGPWFYYYQ